MQAERRLVKNTIIYMVGNIGSKILQMLILPLITAVLLTEEYGYYDLVITTISLVQPVITLQLIEAMFRYLFSGTVEEKNRTTSTVIACLVVGAVVLAVAMVGINIVTDAIQFPLLIYLNYISCIAFTFMQKIARCEQKNIQVAVSGVINTIVMLAVQAITLLSFQFRTDGMLLANCVSYLAAALYLNYYLHVEKKFSTKCIDFTHAKELLKYSLPLVPNSICWWFVAACDKYVISFFLSVASNGIYSIASKFSQLLTLVTSVFQMAWQESSIIESDSDTRNKFYSNTFNAYMRLLLGGYIVLLPVIRVIMPYLVAESYQIGYLYNPLLLIGAVFSAFSQFYGSAYLAFKKTGGAFSTTVIAAVINCCVAIALIKPLGLFGPALGTACAFLVQWLVRMHQMKEYFKVTIDKKALFILLSISLVYTAVYYLHSTWVQIVLLVLGGFVFVCFNRQIIKPIINKLLQR